jgi:hypothetical protein
VTSQISRPEPRPLTIEEFGDALGIGHSDLGRAAIIMLLAARKLDDLVLAEPLIEKSEILFHESAWAFVELMAELREKFADAPEAQGIIEAFMPRLPEMWHRVRAGERLVADVEIKYSDGTAKTVSLQFLDRAHQRLAALAS